MNISLPDPLREFVEDQVESGGYSGISEYMRELVRKAKAESELEDRLLAALDTGDLGEIGADFFEQLKSRARKVSKRGSSRSRTR